MLDDSCGNASARVVYFRLNACQRQNMHALCTDKSTELDDHHRRCFSTWTWKLNSHLLHLCQCDHAEVVVP